MKSQMGKRELNKARKRAAIIVIATRSFLERGYAATTMSAIAEELGGSKATLWAHFCSKQELLAAVIDQQVETFSRDIDVVLTVKSFSLPALRRVCARYLECLLSDSAIRLFRFVVAEGARFPEIAEMFQARGPAKIRMRIIEFYATRFSEPEARMLTSLTTATISGYRAEIVQRPIRPTKAEQDAFVDGLIELIASWADKRP